MKTHKSCIALWNAAENTWLNTAKSYKIKSINCSTPYVKPNPIHFPLKCIFEKEISYETQPKHKSSKTERCAFIRVAQKLHTWTNKTVISKESQTCWVSI